MSDDGNEDFELIARSRAAGFLKAFLVLHKKDRKAALDIMFSLHTSCYSLVDPTERLEQICMITQMLDDVGATKFEDQADFMAFVREKQGDGVD
jgi:hypothetical protein